jgi:hypothetical protein
MPARKQKAKAPKTNVFICQPSYRQDCSRDLRTVIHVAMFWSVVPRQKCDPLRMYDHVILQVSLKK